MSALYAEERGGPEQLRFGPLARPRPTEGEVLVEVHAAAITFAELTWDETWQRRPVIPSHEISGVVAEVGSGVTEWHVEDEVYALIRFDRAGGAAEFVSIPHFDLARRPSTVSHAVAAAVPLAGLTAWQALVDHAHVSRGERVLVHGGAGGVGSFAVQVAAHLGAEVTATARREDGELVARFGAAHVVDFERERFEDAPEKFDVVIDTVSGETLDRSYGVLRPGGRLVTLNAPPDAARAASHHIDATFFVVTPNRLQLDALTALIDSGQLTVPIAAEYPLERGRAAFLSANETGRRPGKTVLIVR